MYIHKNCEFSEARVPPFCIFSGKELNTQRIGRASCCEKDLSLFIYLFYSSFAVAVGVVPPHSTSQARIQSIPFIP